MRFGRESELHRFTATAGGRLARVVEQKLRRQFLDVAHPGAEQEQRRLGVDQDAHALVLDHLVGRLDLLRIIPRCRPCRRGRGS
jgi:hypothetical protein